MGLDIDSLNSAGWPRPRLPYRGANGKTTLPAPWIARIVLKNEVDPSGFNPERAWEMRRDWLCQLCGTPCSDMAFAPVVPDDFHAEGCHEYSDVINGDVYEVSGGPACSVRCCRLAMACCPHVMPRPDADGAVIIGFARCDVLILNCDNGDGGPAAVVKRWEVLR